MAPQARAPVHTRNADLAKYRHKAGALGEGNGAGDKLLRFVLQLLVLAVFRSVQALSIPFGKLFAVWFWMGKSAINISVFLEKQLLKAIAWMSGTGFGRQSRLGKLSHYYLGVDVKRWHVGIAALVLGGVVHSAVSTVRGLFDDRLKRMKQLQALMATSRTYEEWRMYAVELEQLRDQYARPLADHQDYDRRLLNEKLRHLKLVRSTGNPREMMSALRSDLIRNVANITKRQKHSPMHVQTPEPIQAYIREVQEQLEELASWNEVDLGVADKAAFFKVTRHSFGRTALLLSGGGGLGTFHLGVCKALFEKQLLPRVMAGSSVGSIVCAAIAVRTDEELTLLFDSLEQFDIALFQNTTVMDLVLHALNKGHLQDVSYLLQKLRKLVGNCTFLEAFNRTGRILNVTVCPADTNEPPRLLNYMTAPEVLVWSAVACSSAFPGLYPPQYLMGKNSTGQVVFMHAPSTDSSIQRRWRDGSLEFDLPVKTLAETFNCNHFLVSQTNPHIVPLLNIKSVMPAKWASIMEAELKHRLQVLQWLFPEWSVSKYLTLFTQPWEGDITFTLPSMLWNLRKTIVNPTPAELVKATQVGRYATWERMAAIECNCSIEATLDVCSARLQKAAQKQASRHGAIPSWICLPGQPTLGQSPVGAQSTITLGQASPAVALGASYADGITDNDASEVASWGESKLHLSPSRMLLKPSSDQVDKTSSESTTPAEDVLRGAGPVSASSLLTQSRPPVERMPAIVSHPPSPSDDMLSNSYESATSLGTTRSNQGINALSQGHINRLQSIPSMTRTPGTQPQSAGISRKSSVMTGLNTLEHPDWSSGKMSVLNSKCPSTRSSQHQTSPSGSRSGRSSADISLSEAHGHAPVEPPVTQLPAASHTTTSAPVESNNNQGGGVSSIPRVDSHPSHLHIPPIVKPTSSAPVGGRHPATTTSAPRSTSSSYHTLHRPAARTASATVKSLRDLLPGMHSAASVHSGEALRDPAFEQMLLSMQAEPVMSNELWGAFLPLAGTCVTLSKGPAEGGSVLPVASMSEEGNCSVNVLSL